MLAFALLESIVVTLPFVLLAVLLPARFFKNHFVAFSTAIILISSLWMMYDNYHQIDLAALGLERTLRDLALYLFSLALPIALILRFKRVEEIIQAVIQRVAVLMYVYAALACLGFIIVLIRNIL